MLLALQQRRVIEQPVAIVVAHPDDETIGVGGSMHLMRNLLLVHVTDGAPRRLDDAARAGFATAEAYAAARAAELDAAMALSGTRPERLMLGVPDQDASEAMPETAARLRELFRAHRIEAVLTHPYEGGHPDHDAISLAVHLAASGGPDVFEFALYHAASAGGLRTQAFLPGPAETVVALPAHDAARKAAMIACFRTQTKMLSQFDAKTERFRAAPAYDFTAAPHPGPLNYENWGWSMTGTEWRKRASRALEARCAA